MKSNDKPVVKTNESKKNNTTPQKEVSKDKPVFKLQIFASSSKLAPGDKRFKGEKAQYYTENGVYKYTIGESNSYEEIQQIKKNLSEKFKEAFVVAFLNGKKINTQEAVKISQKQK